MPHLDILDISCPISFDLFTNWQIPPVLSTSGILLVTDTGDQNLLPSKGVSEVSCGTIILI